MPQEKLIGSAEAREVLGIDKSTLSRWVQRGMLTPKHQLPGGNGAMLFAAQDVHVLAIDRATAQTARAS